MKRGLILVFLLILPIVYSQSIVGYEPKIIIEEAPYTISLSISNNTIIQDSNINVNIHIQDLKDNNKKQYIINYLVLENNDVIAKDTRTIVIEKENNINKQFYIGKTIDPGKYILKVEAKYLNYTVSDEKEFFVSEKIEKGYYLNYIIYCFIIISVIVILLLILFERNKLKNIEKNQPGAIKKIYEEYKKKKHKEDTLAKLKRELRLLNEARELRVISKESHEKAVNFIENLIHKIKK